MKILIGVDDSPHSNAAVDFARKMTWPEGSKVIAVSVAQLPVAVYAEIYVPSDVPDSVKQDVMRLHLDIAEKAQHSLKAGGLACEARVAEGDPRTVLIDEANREHADLIVLGSHGRTGIAKWLMGSVTNHVVSHAPCSVLVVKLERP